MNNAVPQYEYHLPAKPADPIDRLPTTDLIRTLAEPCRCADRRGDATSSRLCWSAVFLSRQVWSARTIKGIH